MNFKKYIIIISAFVGWSLSLANLTAADTKLSIGSCPIGCTAYTWSAGIADVINKIAFVAVIWAAANKETA